MGSCKDIKNSRNETNNEVLKVVCENLTANVLEDADCTLVQGLRCLRPASNESVSDCIVKLNNNETLKCESYLISSSINDKETDVGEFGWTWLWAIAIVLVATPLMLKLFDFMKNILLNRHCQKDGNAESDIEFMKADIQHEYQELQKVILFCCKKFAFSTTCQVCLLNLNV